MTTTTAVQQQPKKQLTVMDHLMSDRFRQAVSQALPKHLTADRFVRIACLCMTRVPRLKECTQESLFNSLLTLSQLGIEPDGRRAHLIPFVNRKAGCVECQLIVDYKGLVELAMRSGTVSNIHADVVCENDAFVYDRGELKKHTVDYRKPRGAVYAAYALVRFKDESEKCEVMSRDDIEAVRRRSKAADSGPWQTDWNEMAKKTVFKRLSKWLTLSPEFRDAVEVDDEHSGITVDEPRTVQPLVEAPRLFEIPQEVSVPTTVQTNAPEAKPEPADDIPMDFPTAPEPAAKAEKPEDPFAPNPYRDLTRFLESNGFTFEMLTKLALQEKLYKDPDSYGVLQELPVDVVKSLNVPKMRVGLMAGLQAMKAGGAK